MSDKLLTTYLEYFSQNYYKIFERDFVNWTPLGPKTITNGFRAEWSKIK